jgi:hypothetical protein
LEALISSHSYFKDSKTILVYQVLQSIKLLAEKLPAEKLLAEILPAKKLLAEK